MLYRPKLGNGNVIKLVWPIALYRSLNNICWPLADNPSTKAYIFDRFCWVIGFLIFVQTNDAELRYLRQESANLDRMLSGVPTYLVLVEVHLRAFSLGWRKEKFKKFLQKFYTQIYVDEIGHSLLFTKIRRKLRPTLVFSALYLIALMSFLALPFLNIVHHRQAFLYDMTYPFEHTPLYIYLPLLISNIWVGFFVVTMLCGEANLLAEILLHVDARYIILRADLMRHVAFALKHADPATIAIEYQSIIKRTLQQNAELNGFLKEIQNEFSFRIFIIFAFSATMLCTLGFIAYLNPVAKIGYMVWAFAKVMEMLTFGEVGSKLIQTVGKDLDKNFLCHIKTDNLSSMYFDANWELVISKSTNKVENVRLMKLIVLAIELNQSPFSLRGLHFFSVSLRAVVSILQGAASYFTCLISFR